MVPAIILTAMVAPLVDVGVASSSVSSVVVSSPTPSPIAQGQSATLTVTVTTSGTSTQHIYVQPSDITLTAAPAGVTLTSVTGPSCQSANSGLAFTATVATASNTPTGANTNGLTFQAQAHSSNNCSDATTYTGTGTASLPVASFTFTTQPPNGTMGTALSPPPVVTYKNTSGTAVNGAAIAISASGCGSLSGTTSVNTNSSGVATFSNLILSAAGSGCTLTASTSSGVTGGSLSTKSNTFSISGPPPAKVVFTGEPPPTGTAGTALASFNVSVETSGNSVVTSGTGSGDTIALTIASGPGTFDASSTLNVIAANGVATFNNVVLDTVGSYTLKATDSTESLTTTTSTPATVLSPGSAVQLAFTTQPVANANIQATGTGTFPVTVAIEDAYGNVETGLNSGSVTLAIGTNPSSGVLTCSGGLTANVSGGSASFTGCAITKAGSGYTLKATSSPSYLSPTNANPFNITAGSASQLVFGQQPSNAYVGVSMSPAVTVLIEDQNGNLTSSTSSITLTITTNPCGGSPVVTNGTVNAVSGTATFSSLQISKECIGYALTATDSTDGNITVAEQHLYCLCPRDQLGQCPARRRHRYGRLRDELRHLLLLLRLYDLVHFQYAVDHDRVVDHVTELPGQLDVPAHQRQLQRCRCRHRQRDELHREYPSDPSNGRWYRADRWAISERQRQRQLQHSGTVPLSETNFTDSVSGMASNVITRATGTLSGNVCSTLSGATVVTITGGHDSATLTNGCYQYTLTGTNNAGTVATATSAIVMVDTSQPSGGITSPSAGTISGTVSLSSTTASDSVSGIASVAYYACNTTCTGSPPGAAWTLLGTGSSGSPWSASWNTTTVANGSYTLKAVITSNAGDTATTAVVAVTVSNTYSFVLSNPGSPTAGTADSTAIAVQLQVNGSNTGTYRGSAYTGSHTIAFSGTAMAAAPNGTAATPASASLSFNSSGQATIAANTFTFYDAQIGTSLTATDSTNNITGTSGTFTVAAGTASNLAWTNPTFSSGTPSSPCLFTCTDTLGNSGTFKAYVSVTDLYGNIVTSIGSGHSVTVTTTATSGSNGTVTGGSLTFPSTGAATTSTEFTYTGPFSLFSSWTDVVQAATSGGTTYTSATATVTK